MPSEPCSQRARQLVADLSSEFDRDRAALVDELFTFLRFKSISSEPEFASDVRSCASWLSDRLREAGFQVEEWPTRGHPVVFASWDGAGPSAPTVLIYNHYDVQPVDPLELWKTPPFEPSERDGEIFARGAQDNKGQCFYVVAALRSLLRKNGKLPVNIKLCIEGEEETGSHGLTELLTTKRDRLRADHLLVMDLGFHDAESPAITLGVRGIVTMHIEMTGSGGDLHSGTHGGIVYNPNRAMAEVLASLYDREGRVTVPGFYDDVVPVPGKELAKYDLTFDRESFVRTFGAEPTGGEHAFSPLESAWTRPTVEVNGIHGGYTGDGFKTVIPARTIAKVSCRLVPNQDPQKIGRAVKSAIEERTPPGIKVSVTLNRGNGQALRSSADAAAVSCAADAYAAIYGKPCHFILSGGSIPVIPALAEASGAEVAMLGFGLPTDNIHAPNEHFGLDRLKKGFALVGTLVTLLGDEKLAAR